MLVQVVGELGGAIVERAAHAHVVDRAEMLHVLAESQPARVRTHGHTELRGEEQDRQDLVDAADPARVDLAIVDGLGLHELLEDHAVGRVLTGRHAHGRDRAADGRVAEHVVGTRRLLDPAKVERLEVLHARDRLVDVPHLIGVGHQRQVADLLAHHLAPADVARDVEAHLGLEAAPAVGERLAAEVAHLLLAVAEPPGRREVRGVPVAFEVGDAIGTCRREGAQQVERLVGVDRVGEVAEVDARDELLRREVAHEAPQRFALDARPQVPYRVHERGGREVDHPLFRPEPPELAVAGEPPPEPGAVRDQLLEVAPHDQRRELLDRRAAQVVAAADGERHADALVRTIGREEHVRARVVGILVHGVGARERDRRRCPDVEGAGTGDAGHRRRMLESAPRGAHECRNGSWW